MKANAINWFEIPVTDMERAIKFYETVFNIRLSRNIFGSLDMAWFPLAESGAGASGSLVRNEKNYRPSSDGVLIYFSSLAEDLNDELGRVEAAGGKIILSKTQISEEHGFMALLTDTEGNRIALHSNK